MESLLDSPELKALRSPGQIVRIPPELDIAVTPRVIRLIDCEVVQHLKSISQLGLVSLVYPGATHSRFEHSLGVFRNAQLFLQRLVGLEDFEAVCSTHDAKLLLVTSLLHDVGHWPFCHAIEDMQLQGTPRHEALARQRLESSELQKVLRDDWQVDANDVAELLSPKDKQRPKFPLLATILSGPIDIDKLDYLDRDSLHAGVPYGRNFDRNRLISQLCLGSDRRRLAITEKAKTAAEMMVFARYVMFSEVYWHHAVRAATCMLQRAVWEMPSGWLSDRRSLGEDDFVASMKSSSISDDHQQLIDGLFGKKRQLYKRVAEYHSLVEPDLHKAIARRPYRQLVELSSLLIDELRAEFDLRLPPLSVLIDAPPTKLEVQFEIEVKQASGRYFSLGTMSPVACALANEQFDNLVKRVRVFASTTVSEKLRELPINLVLNRALARVEG